MSKNIQNLQNEIKAKFGFGNKVLKQDLEKQDLKKQDLKNPSSNSVIIFEDDRFEVSFNPSTRKLELKTLGSNEEVNNQYVGDLSLLSDQVGDINHLLSEIQNFGKEYYF